MASASPDPKGEELAAMIRAIRERVRSRHPDSAAGIPLPDLMPVVHARDSAEAKVAAIGTVNPRPPGALNNAIQAVKRSIARALNWFVRDQVEFNRATLECIEAVLEALNENKRALAALAGQVEKTAGYEVWRDAWEKRLNQAEIGLLRSVADLSAAYDQRLARVQADFQKSMDLQHAAFTGTVADAQERQRLSLERLIHQELRVVRQRLMTSASIAAAEPTAAPAMQHSFDAGHFAERFRGSEDDIRSRQARYADVFRGCENVLDVGCGRGEFLDVMRDNAVRARGIDLDSEAIAYCRSKGLDAERADMFEHLAAVPAASLDGIFCSQVVEHLAPERLPHLIRLCADALAPGGVAVFETPNPECLAIFASHFYLDPTHVRPVPPALLVFYLEEFGFGGIKVERISPAGETMPTVNSLPPDFRETFFGGLDYNVVARRL